MNQISNLVSLRGADFLPLASNAAKVGGCFVVGIGVTVGTAFVITAIADKCLSRKITEGKKFNMSMAVLSGIAGVAAAISIGSHLTLVSITARKVAEVVILSGICLALTALSKKAKCNQFIRGLSIIFSVGALASPVAPVYGATIVGTAGAVGLTTFFLRNVQKSHQ